MNLLFHCNYLEKKIISYVYKILSFITYVKCIIGLT
jgi:hypothetical protein